MHIVDETFSNTLLDQRRSPCGLPRPCDAKLHPNGNAGAIFFVVEMPIHLLDVKVLAGILPISRVSAVPLCAYNAANFLPIERIYKLVHPTTNVPPVKDKRTWREGMKPEELPDGNRPTWTAMDILTAYADAKGWVTAKAGRPDVHRAGNART